MSAVDAEARENLEATSYGRPPREIPSALSGKINQIISDSFLLCLKSKNFHRRVSGLHFRDCHLMLEEHTDSLLGTADPPADRGGATIRSLGQVAGSRTLADNEDAGCYLKRCCWSSWAARTPWSRPCVRRTNTCATMSAMSQRPSQRVYRGGREEGVVPARDGFSPVIPEPARGSTPKSRMRCRKSGPPLQSLACKP
jgi:hypothetical protein